MHSVFPPAVATQGARDNLKLLLQYGFADDGQSPYSPHSELHHSFVLSASILRQL